MTRLTSEMRSTTVANLLKAKLTDEYVAIADRIALTAEKIYNNQIPSFIQELPAGTCQTYNYVHFQIGDSYMAFRFNGMFDVKDEEQNYNNRPDWSHFFLKREASSKPFPYNKGGQCLLQLSPGHKMYGEVKKVVDDAAEFIDKFFTTRKKSLGILNSITTVPKLLEVWPEVKPYIAEEAPKASLPALPIDDLNKQLGLS